MNACPPWWASVKPLLELTGNLPSRGMKIQQKEKRKKTISPCAASAWLVHWAWLAPLLQAADAASITLGFAKRTLFSPLEPFGALFLLSVHCELGKGLAGFSSACTETG